MTNPDFEISPDESALKELQAVDWKAVYPGLLRYAVYRCKKFETQGDAIFDPEGLLQESVARVFGCGQDGNYRAWNRKRYPEITDFLKSVMDSVLSHAYEEFKAQRISSLDADDTSNRDLSTEADPAAACFYGILSPLDPSEELLRKERLIERVLQMRKAAEGDSEMELVVMCLEDGITKPQEIATISGIEVKRTHKILRRLREKIRV